jgi:hypothetical protein
VAYYSIDGEGNASIAKYAKHFNLFSGVELSSKLLEGTGRGMRHIKIQGASDIEEEIHRLLKQSAKLIHQPNGCSPG